MIRVAIVQLCLLYEMRAHTLLLTGIRHRALVDANADAFRQRSKSALLLRANAFFAIIVVLQILPHYLLPYSSLTSMSFFRY